jgi:hypothetical protein
MDQTTTVITSDLVNLDGLTLAELSSYDETALAATLAPLLRQIDDPTSSVGGHNS